MKNFAFDITISIIFINVCISKQKPFCNEHWESQHRYQTKNNLYQPQANLTVYEKGAYYRRGKKSLIIYPRRLRMSLITWKSLKLLWNNICTLINFIHWKNILINHELSVVLQKLLIILALVLRFYLMVHCMSIHWLYTLIWSDLISFPCVNLMS